MPRHDVKTIVSMAVIGSAAATLLHEGVGHGVVAWLRGDIPTELTSNHLSSVKADRWVEAGGTLVNLCAGSIALLASRAAGSRSNLRYFLWIFAALNLLPGAGYFLFSGIFGFGDWEEVIRGAPHQMLLRVLMTIFGAGLYVLVVRLLAVAVEPYCASRRDYNTVGRIPYYAACLFSCAAGALDPLGLKLFLFSTVPAAFGGSSGLMWADSLLTGTPGGLKLVVRRQAAWWVAAAVLGGAYVLILGPGIKLSR
jgi:hypothetical protein